MELFIDTETTGLSHKTDKIVELTIVDENGNVLLDTLVNPNRQIPEDATDVHGITNEMVRRYPNIYALMPKIRKIVKNNDVIAYNAPFDVGFFPDELREASSIRCAMRVFQEYKESKKPYKLSDAADLVGHKWSGKAHRALADTLACKSVWEATADARQAGRLKSALVQRRAPDIEHDDDLNQWAADSTKRLLRKFANKGLSQRDLLKTVMSESIFMALSSDDIDEPLVRIDIEESIKTATKAIKKI